MYTASQVSASGAAFSYERRQAQDTPLFQAINRSVDEFFAKREAEEKTFPLFVKEEFEEFLRCGLPQYGFLRFSCEGCKKSSIVSFSCKKRGFCPSCGSKRMHEFVARMVEERLPPDVPLRQWVISFPLPIRLWLSTNSRALGITHRLCQREISRFYEKRFGCGSFPGSVTWIQRFGSALNLNTHFHFVFLDGVYKTSGDESPPVFVRLENLFNNDLYPVLLGIERKVLRALSRMGYAVREGEVPGEVPIDQMYEENSGYLDSVVAAHHLRAGRSHDKVRNNGLERMRPVVPRDCLVVRGNLSLERNFFSLNASVGIRGSDREGKERLLSYIARPAVTGSRLEWRDPETKTDLIYRLKTAWKNGATEVYFTALELLERLAALVPPPYVNLVRYSGCLAARPKT